MLRTALGQGLTEREQANIANTARARSTMMGRTFDQSGAIAEAEARVAEDNAMGECRIVPLPKVCLVRKFSYSKAI